ncbi:MAG: thioesterase family protein, partial [Anaerolineae bacterium]|nr:thioesterase family protein [Anaerolineae bacterium]
ASAGVGFTYDWYFNNRHSWVVRKMQIRYLRPLSHGDEVTLRTWVSDVRRIYSHREYDLRRTEDDSPVLRARAKWVYVNLDTLRPARIPDAAEVAFQPTGELPDLQIHLRHSHLPAANTLFASDRRVQHYEIDPTGHVNNAVYVNWCEQALFDAYAATGFSVQDAGSVLCPVAREIEYFQSALDGMLLRIESRPVALSRTRVAWEQDVRDRTSGALVARDYVVAACLDRETGQPARLPYAFRQALADGSGAV